MNRILIFCVLLVSTKGITPCSAQNSSQKPRILIYHDMEGLSGENDTRMFRYSHPEQYKIGRELLTHDVNAVIAGLFEGGAGLVNVVDAHGSGNQNPDVLLDKLDKRASMVSRDQPFRVYVDLVEPNVYDAIVCVGMHAKTGSGGFASHTETLGMDIIFNNQSITETELISYSWGRVGVPVIFVSGDDKLLNDLKTMPWIEFAMVKKATSASTVDLLPLVEARRDLKEKAAKSIGNIQTATAMKLKEPIKATLRAFPPASLELLRNVPGIDYQDNSVTFMAENFVAAYDGVTAMIDIASTGSYAITREVIRSLPDGKSIQLQIDDARYNRWLDFESGRWRPEPVSPPKARKYFGAR